MSYLIYDRFQKVAMGFPFQQNEIISRLVFLEQWSLNINMASSSGILFRYIVSEVHGQPVTSDFQLLPGSRDPGIVGQT